MKGLVVLLSTLWTRGAALFTLSPNAEVVFDCKWGSFLTLKNDAYISRSLKEYGEWTELEVEEVYKHYAKKGSVVVDVGANIGAFTVPLAKLVGATGVVHAIEPLRVLHNLMVANAALNGCDNVASHRAYVGNATLSPRHALALHHDYLTLSNYGSYSAASQPASLVEKVGTTAVENVGTIAIDDLGLWGCTLIKIDVEGAEMGVLQGAQETIAKFKPAIYTEAEPPRPERPNSDFARVGGVLDVLNGLDYECFQHLVPLWRPDNHRGAPAFFLPNGSPTTHLKSANALCVHWSEIHDLPPALQRRRPMKVGEAITMTGENSRPEGLDTVHIPGALHDEV